MKTLLLLRHARPSQISPTGRDFDRPLVAAGREQVPLVARLLLQHDLAPDRIVCSPAVRARETLALVADAAALAAPARFDARIFDATLDQLFDVLSEVEDTAETLLLVGHNPGLEELILQLAGTPAALSPATLARLELDITRWREARTARARLVFALPPEAA